MEDFHIQKSEAKSISSNITSAFQAGAFFGALFCLPVTEAVGRKWALQLNVLIFIVGAVIMTAAQDQLSYMCMVSAVYDNRLSDKSL